MQITFEYIRHCGVYIVVGAIKALQPHVNLSQMDLNRQSVETSIAKHFNIDSLGAYGHVVRNEKGWRENEILIEYSWIVTIARSFVGWGGIFIIKLARNEFRDIKNPEKLIRGAFIHRSDGKITDIYFEELYDFADPIRNTKDLDLFNANKEVILDGVSYEFIINGKYLKTLISVNNPTSASWKSWEENVWEIGQQLASKAKNEELISLFN